MWFRPRSQHSDSDRFRVPSIRNRSKKAAAKCIDAESRDANTAKTLSIAASNGSTLQSPVVGRQHVSLNVCDDDSTKEKNKVIRTDQKYKKNRVSKSSSRTKVHDLKPDKSIPNKSANNSSSCVNQRKVSTQLVDPIVSPKKPPRRNTTLNLNALLRYKSFISGSTKKLTHDDFERLRRKSLGETGTVRRKSNPDAHKKKSSDSKKEQRSATKEHIDQAYESSNEDFHSCNEEDQIDGGGAIKTTSALHPESKTSKMGKKSRSKNEKKGFQTFLFFNLLLNLTYIYILNEFRRAEIVQLFFSTTIQWGFINTKITIFILFAYLFFLFLFRSSISSSGNASTI